MTRKEEHDIRKKLKVLDHVKETGNVSQTYRYFGASRDIFFCWKRDYKKQTVLAIANCEAYKSLPHSQITPSLTKKGLYAA